MVEVTVKDLTFMAWMVVQPARWAVKNDGGLLWKERL